MKLGVGGRAARGVRVLTLTLPVAMLGTKAYAQTLGGGTNVEIPLVRIAAALVVGILIALGAALLLKKHLGAGFKLPRLFAAPTARSTRQIQIHETRRISPHADLCRFSASNREYLVIVSAHGTEVLDVSPSDTAGADKTPASNRS